MQCIQVVSENVGTRGRASGKASRRQGCRAARYRRIGGTRERVAKVWYRRVFSPLLITYNKEGDNSCAHTSALAGTG